MANQTPNVFDQGYKYQKGLSGSNYKLTGEIWGVAIGDNSDEADYSQAGFYTSGIQNTGTSPFHGVTVTAVVQIISITGKVQFAVALYSAEGFMPWIYTFSTPGTYTLVTQPEELPPNKVHQGFTYMICSPETANTPTGCYAKVVSIKVNLGSQ
jgi:hypothetical protein